jgi:phage tail-like protein
MAVTKDEIKTSYPLPVYNYRVEIGSDTVGFSEVSGLSITYETTTYKESPVESGIPGPRVMYMPAQKSAPTISLKKWVIPGSSVATLFNWINSTQINQIEKKDIYVRLCDETGTPVISWHVVNAFPTKLDAPTFDAKSGDAAIETMQLMADAVFVEEA